MDQSNGFRRLALVAAVAASLALSACGGSMSAESGGQAALPDPQIETPVHVGGTPVALAVGAGGVWVADDSGSRVFELDPMSGRPMGQPIPVASGPDAIAVGEGAVWVASGNGTVTRIDPETGTPRRAPVRVADPGGIAAGEGAVWITSHANATVTRLDPMTLKAVGDSIPVGAGPTDVAVGAGSAWVANTDDGTVTGIDASSGDAADPIALADYQVLALCFGEDGVWAAKTDDRLARTIEVVHIDPSSGQLSGGEARIPAAIPVRLAAGEGGVWATLAGGVRLPATNPAPGQVALLDPSALGSPPRLIHAGERPAGIAIGEGAVWVADSGSGDVTRIGL